MTIIQFNLKNNLKINLKNNLLIKLMSNLKMNLFGFDFNLKYSEIEKIIFDNLNIKMIKNEFYLIFIFIFKKLI